MTIADLVLRSGVARQVISGRKVLKGGLQVNGVLQVGSLNGVDVTALNRTIVRVDDASVEIRVDTVGSVLAVVVKGVHVMNSLGIKVDSRAEAASLVIKGSATLNLQDFVYNSEYHNVCLLCVQPCILKIFSGFLVCEQCYVGLCDALR